MSFTNDTTKLTPISHAVNISLPSQRFRKSFLISASPSRFKILSLLATRSSK